MCGRTACTLAPCDLQKACGYKDRQGSQQTPGWRDAPNGRSYTPSYNIAPGAYTPVLLSSDHLQEYSSTQRVIQPMQWGLIPSWHKGSAGNKSYETNNCRAESMLEKMTYKVPLQKGRRCVVLAEGFYEWKRSKDSKQPYYIYFPHNGTDTFGDKIKTDDKLKQEAHPECCMVKHEPHSTDSEVKHEPFSAHVEVKPEPPPADLNIKHGRFCIKQETNQIEHTVDYYSSPKLLTMAGVFDIWSPPGESSPVYSYSVITVDSSSAMSWIHHRMPAILTSDEEIEEWLNFGEVPLTKAAKLIRSVTCIQSHPVSNVVNNSRHNTKECVKKIDISKPKKSASSAFMSAWLLKGSKVKPEDEPEAKKQRQEFP